VVEKQIKPKCGQVVQSKWTVTRCSSSTSFRRCIGGGDGLGLRCCCATQRNNNSAIPAHAQLPLPPIHAAAPPCQLTRPSPLLSLALNIKFLFETEYISPLLRLLHDLAPRRSWPMPMPQTNATLPGMLLLFKDYLPAAVLSGDSFYSALFVAMFIVQVAHASCAAATRKPSSCF